MEYITEVNYEGKQGTILVVMFMDQVNLLVGDIYAHKTHRTQFNKKIDHPLKDGDYKIKERCWIAHQADVHSLSLHITITDL